MAGNRDLKMKAPMNDDYGETPLDGFNKGVKETTAHYREILAMYKEMNDAIEARHQEEIEVVRLQAKLEVLDHLNDLFELINEKENLESELRLAEAKMDDVKVPSMDWFKLGEPKMW
ncbi:unnamed protein product [Eruca vesicaria subsp. sativa]|uniref:Uncharacterized protein n=1 Tax=Eruca vesicaria subsp. sativa TaxID=29727 RepID=A0ABC8KF18_ERUVS|nr:unnamed protein product [Eruca vesicaria subsp. sativa]